MDSRQAGPAVEIRIEGEDRFDFHALHGRDVKRVTCGKFAAMLRDLSRAEDVSFFNREDFVNDVEGRLKGGADGLSAVDSRISMQDLL